MALLRIGILVMTIMLGFAGVLTGAVVGHAALTTGRIEITSVRGGAAGAPMWTIERVREPVTFWSVLLAVGIAPLVLGAAAVGWGWRRIGRG